MDEDIVTLDDASGSTGRCIGIESVLGSKKTCPVACGWVRVKVRRMFLSDNTVTTGKVSDSRALTAPFRSVVQTSRYVICLRIGVEIGVCTQPRSVVCMEVY
jgi:hypothetical protein